MIFSRRAAACLAATFLMAAPAAWAQSDAGGHPWHHGGMFADMSPEARALMMDQMRKDTANMSADQKRAWRQQQRAKFAAMSDADKQKYAAGMQAEWDALPQGEKDRIRQEMADFRSHHPMMGGGR